MTSPSSTLNGITVELMDIRQQDVDNTKPGSIFRCPLVRSARRNLGLRRDTGKVSCLADALVLEGPLGRRYVKLSKAARAYRERFDYLRTAGPTLLPFPVSELRAAAVACGLVS